MQFHRFSHAEEQKETESEGSEYAHHRICFVQSMHCVCTQCVCNILRTNCFFNLVYMIRLVVVFVKVSLSNNNYLVIQ